MTRNLTKLLGNKHLVDNEPHTADVEWGKGNRGLTILQKAIQRLTQRTVKLIRC